MMNFIIQDLLDYSLIKGGTFKKNNEKFNIRETIEKVMKIQRAKANELKISFESKYVNVAENEQEARLGYMSPYVYTDEDRVMQVLLALQSNALKFTNQGKVTIEVKILEGYLQISVIDTGIGIPKEDQGKLFKLFGFVKNSDNMNTHGIGLGLVIAKSIVSQFGGQIDFKSEEKQGSTFTF